MPTIQIQDIISRNVTDLFDLSSLKEKERRTVFETMIQTVFNRIIARLIDGLSASARAQVFVSLDQGQTQAVDMILAQHDLPDLATLACEEATLYKTQLLMTLSASEMYGNS